MWGQVFVDYSMHRNFNVGFTSHKNDIHIHLSQWQYWWWFWFSLVWAVYFLIIIRIVLIGNEDYKLTINTSLRSHGKWGDFIVALIPLSWCGNILVNSNFILRMIEWQNESSLFVVRIQGKQWYWSYKFNSDTNYRLQNVYINVGNNNWYKSSNSSNHNFNINNSTLSFLYEYEFRKAHKKILNTKIKDKIHLKLDNYNLSSLSLDLYNQRIKKNLEFFHTYINDNYEKKLTWKLNKIKVQILSIKLMFPLYRLNMLSKIKIYNDYNSFSNLRGFRDNKVMNSRYSNLTNMFSNVFNNKNFVFKENLFTIKSKSWIGNYEFDRLEEIEESLENLRLKTSNFPIKLIKGIINKNTIKVINNTEKLNKSLFFTFRLNNDNIVQKISQVEQFWGFRQKKYKKYRSFFFNQNYRYHNKTYSIISTYNSLSNYSKYNLYNAIKINKYKSENIPATLARRLLRTKRTLVLPAHINITLITSSYDVVHSWFVPGLGLKIDCVPGRSTHHTLYIDNVGFYYGQCAEICGRYHHHMPIRVCALNYEHFLLWWQTKGLPRMYRSKTFTKHKSILLNKFKD